MIETVTGAINTGMSSVVADLGSGIAAVIPTVLPIFGAILAIGIILRIAKKVTGR